VNFQFPSGGPVWDTSRQKIGQDCARILRIVLAVIDTVVAMVVFWLVLGAAFFQQNQPTAAISRICDQQGFDR
jgi:hypothetical protein